MTLVTARGLFCVAGDRPSEFGCTLFDDAVGRNANPGTNEHQLSRLQVDDTHHCGLLAVDDFGVVG